jgi:protein SCO1/2
MMRRLMICRLLVLCGLALAANASAASLKGGIFDPPRVAPDFTLPGSNGKPVTLSSFRGKVVILEFGYTSCADVCPVSLAALTTARKKLGALAKDVQVLFVTVDPERDSLKILNAYLAPFDPTIIGIGGSTQQLAKMRNDYGITATRRPVGDSKTDYTVGHSSYLYFIDRKGALRSMLPFGRPADDIAHDATLLLKE